jgi:4-alpha-glucanotransferase
VVRFRVNYQTNPGQNVLVVGNDKSLGGWHHQSGLHMSYRAGNNWEAEVQLTDVASGVLEYKYVLVDEGTGCVFWEAGSNRTVNLKEEPTGVVEMCDTWKSTHLPELSYLHTTLFRDVIFGRDVETKKRFDASSVKSSLVVRFKITSGITSPKHKIVVVGSSEALGSWNVFKGVSLQYTYPEFEADVVVDVRDLPLEYKYVVVDEHNNVVEWENGGNRVIELDPKIVRVFFDDHGRNYTVKTSDIFRRSNYHWRAMGVAIPIFSLRTHQSMGVGEFLDLKPFADLCNKFGSRLIQILPINDTSCRLNWRDSYPYSALSVFALHPIYLRIKNLTDDTTILKEAEAAAQKLNALHEIDYEAVYNTKINLAKRVYMAQKKNFLASLPVQDFIKENEEWLTPYAVFVHLRDVYKTSNWGKWDAKHKNLSAAEVKKLADELADEVGFSYFLQYNLHVQLKEATEYAEKMKIGIKGDLPIGVNPASTDTWMNPNLFRLQMSTGAPPDQFSEDGQNWGFPTYNWAEMAKDNYSWWRARLQSMAKYFHAFRIDHILGFFRIWEIPRSSLSGLMGYFNPSTPVHRHELERLGLWDIQRLTEPYIRWGLLEYYFGSDAKYVSDMYFYVYGWDRFQFKTEFNTERKVLDHIKSLPDDSEGARKWRQKLQRGLVALQQNVIFLRYPDNPDMEFIPRVNMHRTISFQELDAEAQRGLWRIYVSYYYERQESLWYNIGMNRLPLIKNATRMLVCGEDLGMVPKCVEPVMNDLSILGLRVQRMPSNPDDEFGFPASYGYMTVNTTSSHDTSSLRAWWEEDRAKSQHFWNAVLGQQGAAPWFCEDWLVEMILRQHLHSPSMWAVFPLQDLFALRHDLRVEDPNGERVNVPANPKHYWRYRMHVYVEDLLANEHFIGHVKALVRESGRAHEYI